MVGLHLFPEPSPGVSPQLIASNSILQLSTVELEQAIIRELDANPALEMVEQPTCPVCGGKLSTGVCVRCSGMEAVTPLSSSPSSSDAHFSEADWGAPDSQEEVDPLNFVAVPLTLPELLEKQLRLMLPEREHVIALNVVGNLDERGYLTITPEKIAELLNVEKMRVEAVVKELQSLDPAGIGASTVEECLLLQLERLIERGATPAPITRVVINRYLPQLGHHQFEHICSALNVSRTEVEEAFLFIRSNLHPYPAHHYFAASEHSVVGRELLIPSVLIHRNAAADYEIEVIESQRFLLRFNPAYRRLQQHPELTFSPGEREHVTHFLDRARLFLRQLQRRSLLLHKLMLFLVNYQRDFLDHGLTHLRPLSQKIAAQEIGVHVSTISRAIANKYAQLPSRELIPLHLFFSAEQRVQQVIRQIIASEKECLSDAAIARLLSEQHGVTLSRQMVANYRIELSIPAARQRAILRKQGRTI
ncbi:MAG TPA: hypothetical protein VFB60_26730 [Ktedonobacteraceae bacterium]|nr:hypothetical protein [Ktedonobacteraceae bacterium]